MMPRTQLNRWRGVAARLWHEDEGPQIAEFAVSLPLLVLFLIGIFDFTQAVTLKQKLTNAAREGARVAAADPASDLPIPSSGIPASIGDAFQVVDNYLISEHISDCGLSASPPTFISGLTWQSSVTSAPCNASSPFVLTINRGSGPIANGNGIPCVQTAAQGSVNFIVTCVTIQYPYQWQFGRVASLIGGALTLPTAINTTAISFNEN